MKHKNIFILFITFLVFSGPQFKCTEDSKVNIESLLIANQQFSFDLYNQLKNKKGNLFFSPYSISSALAMTYAGAQGETKNQMAKVLHFNDDNIDIHKSYSLLNDSLKTLSNENAKLEIVNGLWADSNYKFLDSYFNLINENYNALVQNIDMKDGVKSAEIINSWINEKTYGKILDIVNEDDFELARLVIANAIYFKGMWNKSFKKEKTRQLDFILSDKTKQKTDFMVQSDEYNYFQNEDAQILELPYQEGKMSMLLILPKAEIELYKIEEKMNNAIYNSWLNSLKSTKLDVYIPKFTLNYSTELNEVLSGLGMPIAFSKNADFSGMTGKKDLQIDKVKHKSFIEVNEEGTEASAATVVIMREKSAVMNKVFKANRPFIFMIKENSRNFILFIGRVENPN